jgi:hypothetical protein
LKRLSLQSTRWTRILVGVALAGWLCGGLLWMAPGMADTEKPAYPVLNTASGVSRTVQAVTGFTPITGWVANRILHRELGRHVQGALHTRIRLFSGTDLLGGKAKAIAVSGHNVLLEGLLPLTDFRLESREAMPLYVSKGRHPILLQPVQFKVSAVMTEADMNRLLTSEKGRKLLTGLTVSIPPFGPQRLDFMQPAVTLDDGRLTLRTQVNKSGAPVANALPVTVSGKITPERSALALSNLDLQIEGIQDTAELEQLIEAYFGELVNLNHIKVARHRVKVVIEQSNVVDHCLNLEATVTVKPEDKALKAFLSQQ